MYTVYSSKTNLSNRRKISTIVLRMSLLRFLIILGAGTICSWTAWVLVLLTLDPITGGPIALLLFYGSFFLAMFGTATIIGFFIRFWLEKEKVLFRQISTALRHGTVVGVATTVMLLLQSQRVLNIWAILGLLALAVVIELFVLAGETRRPVTE